MTSKTAPSRVSNLRELIASLGLTVQIQAEIADILEEYEKQMFALKEDNKRLIADYRALEGRCNSLDKRYSELLYKFSEAVQASRK